MRLFKIHVRHYSQKDSHEAIEGFVLAGSDEEVYYFIGTELGYSSREELDEEHAKEVTVYNEDYEEIGTETQKQRLIRYKGEMFDPDARVSDLYYGATQYGWEDMGEISEAEIAFLRRKDLLLDERLAREKSVQEAEAAVRRAARDKEGNT